jgi:DNA uptake protein ComE-like DNA-binding protein
MTTGPRPPRFWKDNAVLRWVRRYLGYSRGEARGLVALVALMVAAAVVPVLLRPDLPVYLPEADQQELNQLVATLKEHRTSTNNYASRYPKREYAGASSRPSRYPTVARVPLAPFDPNSLTAEGWEARGVPHFVAARIVKYGTAAGGFKAKAQIKKMYGLEDSVYQRLAPFIQLPDEMPKRERPDRYAARDGQPAAFSTAPAGPGKFPSKPRNLQPFDLNTADTTQLMQIRGIGRGRAKWVVAYGRQLGGYLREEQLDEVFVLRDAPDLRDSLRKYTFIAAGFVPQQVPVNTATFDELYGHPYIRKGLARLIVAYRQQHGPFKSAEDLKSIPRLKPEDWEKMRPYLRCE